MIGSRNKRIAVALVGFASAVGILVGATPARAIGPSAVPVQVQLNERGALAGCPGGAFVNFEPDPTSAPSFTLVNPGPSPCPPGIALVQDPDGTGASRGSAVSLPVQASSCSTAQAIFTQVADLLGGPAGVPGVAPAAASIDPTGVCPEADAAFAAVQAALARVPVVPGSRGLVLQPQFGHEVIVAFLQGDPDQPIVIGSLNFTGTAPAGVFFQKEVIVAFVDGDPDQPIVVGSVDLPRVFALVSSATPGVSVILCRFC
jgi:hypothetical protein